MAFETEQRKGKEPSPFTAGDKVTWTPEGIKGALEGREIKFGPRAGQRKLDLYDSALVHEGDVLEILEVKDDYVTVRSQRGPTFPANPMYLMKVESKGS
jgi:hypothetical protein